MDATQRQWLADFDRAYTAIPAEWVSTDTDGWTGINPEHADRPLVQHYASLCRVGYARGWL